MSIYILYILKAATLKKFMDTLITFIDSGSLSSLINLQYLEIVNNDIGEPYEDVDWERWEKCLDKTLNSLKLRLYLPSSI